MSELPRRLILKHLGNLGDHLFLVGALLEGIARVWPRSAITLVTAWGYKDRRGRWGKRNQDGYCLALMKENPHVDQLVHWSDFGVALDATVCREEGRAFPTWNRAHFDAVAPEYDRVVELDVGLATEENPLERMATLVGLPHLRLGRYSFYPTPRDRAVGRALAADWPHPRVVLLEGLAGPTMRGWNPQKASLLAERLRDELGIAPHWWGSAHVPLVRGRRPTLREHIAFLAEADLAIGVLGAPLHFAAAAGVPTITLNGGQPVHRASPGFFLNPTIADQAGQHVTIDGPTCEVPCLLKRAIPCRNLRGSDRVSTDFENWRNPGRQSDKSCVATIPVQHVFAAVEERLTARHLLS